MKWFKFIIYFQLFASALLNLLSGISTLTGGQYGSSGDAEMVYTAFSGLKTLDVLYGVCAIALAAGDIFVRMRLAGYRANAPKLYLGVLAAAVVLSLIYIIGVFVILGEWADIIDLTAVVSQYTSQLFVSIIMIGANHVYFKKRAHLFVN